MVTLTTAFIQRHLHVSIGLFHVFNFEIGGWRLSRSLHLIVRLAEGGEASFGPLGVLCRMSTDELHLKASLLELFGVRRLGNRLSDFLVLEGLEDV